MLEVVAPRVGEALEAIGRAPWAVETSVFGTRIHVVVAEPEEGRREIGRLLDVGRQPGFVDRAHPALARGRVHPPRRGGGGGAARTGDAGRGNAGRRSGPVRRLRAVVVKELRQVRRDPFSLAMLIGLPAFMLVLYGYALNFDVRHVRLAVQDRDGSRASRELVASFTRSTYFDLVATPAGRRGPRGAHPAAGGEGDPGHPGGLRPRPRRRPTARPCSSSWTAPTRPPPRRSSATRGRSSPSRTSRSWPRRSRAAASACAPPLDLEPRVLFNPELESTQFLVPGLIGFLLMLTAVLSTALSVVREKERGTMEQLRVAPLRTWELIVGQDDPLPRDLAPRDGRSSSSPRGSSSA